MKKVILTAVVFLLFIGIGIPAASANLSPEVEAVISEKRVGDSYTKTFDISKSSEVIVLAMKALGQPTSVVDGAYTWQFETSTLKYKVQLAAGKVDISYEADETSAKSETIRKVARLIKSVSKIVE